MILYKRQQNSAGRKRENADFEKGWKRKPLCVISVANKNNNNKGINVANKKRFLKM